MSSVLKDRNLEVPSPQAVPIPNSKVPGRSAIYRNILSVNSLTQIHLANPITTAFEAFEVSCKLRPDKSCLGHREKDPITNKWGPYIWETYTQIRKRRDDFGSGMLHVYRDFAKGTKENIVVGILAINRVEWVITDLACQAHSIVTVPLYDTLGPDSTEYIINLTSMDVMVASMDNIPKLLSMIDRIPSVKLIISMDSKPADQGKLDLLKGWGKGKGVVVTDFLSVETIGSTKPVPYKIPRPEDIFTINFTSGTTGNPKGVVLTHGNAAAAAIAPLSILLPHSKEKDEYGLSFLPLAHIYERNNIIGGFHTGMSIGMFHGVITELLEDIQELKPTLLAAVPRLLLRMEAAIRARTVNAPGFRGALSRRALAAKYARMDAGGDQYHPLWDRVWSKKIREFLGGRLELIISGSAPLPKETIRFLKAALACEVIEGYGMTETGASATVAHPGDKVIGHVGPPVPHCEVALADVPSMNYSSEDKPWPRGELLIRGSMRLQEYYKEKAKTDEAIESDGFLHTGDIATIDNEGRVYIIDRVKNIFKLSQGEYIAAERLEAMYSSCNLVAQIFVHGDSCQCYLVSVVGVDPITFPVFASAVLGRQILPNELDKVLSEPKLRKAVVAELDKVASLRGLAGFEKIKNVFLAVEPFTIANDTLTPSFKLKRPQAVKMFRKEIDKMYAETGTSTPPLKANL